ncbi:Flr1p [Sugiyamaella lignohabitans]|uniref:Flr1p n=1 Tax=Sugiyamaella lignohabitans TaxID=796027 RepID=A0A167CAG3_9ASCO|nr:Flr1p [Sugiyamaella lignohabitans]ANB11430.1 Flr1p [Sugiyamaella lignohabitans]
MTYSDTFRNTFVVDLLELAGLVKVSSNFVPQPSKPVKSGLSNVSLDKEEDSDNEAEPTTVRDEELTIGDEKKEDEEEEGVAAPPDPFLVDWNGPDDPENPQNWPSWKKGITVFQVMLLTCATYMGSSIYTPGQEEIQEQFGVGHVAATLNLSVYVFGYGLGPMIFSPLSEEVKIGRNRLYIVTLFLFFIFQIPAALATNLGGLIVVRFIAGFLSSPAISTGGATLGDFVSSEKLPLLIGAWACGAVAAPSAAPLLGAAMTVAKNWRYTFWLLLAICAFTFLVMSFFFSETLPANVLHRRANRIRKETGDDRYYTVAELAQQGKDWPSTIKESLWRPLVLIITEPGVLAMDSYIALVYGCFYLFFEAFPIVFVGIYDFSLVELGTAYVGFIVGCAMAYGVLLAFMVVIVKPRIMAAKFVPEHFLILAMWVCMLLPFSLFLFGWTAKVHWILPVIAEVFFVIGTFNLFQCAFGYLASSYPRYIASVFAGNALVRSTFASAFPLFGQAMYNGLAIDGYPVAWGSSLVGFVTLAMAAIPFVLYKYGPALRGKSQYAN